MLPAEYVKCRVNPVIGEIAPGSNSWPKSGHENRADNVARKHPNLTGGKKSIREPKNPKKELLFCQDQKLQGGGRGLMTTRLSGGKRSDGNSPSSRERPKKETSVKEEERARRENELVKGMGKRQFFAMIGIYGHVPKKRTQ